MLTREHILETYSYGQVIPDRLLQSTHGHYVLYAQRMLEVYRQGIGLAREKLHRRVEKIFVNEPNCPTKRIKAFCKLLDDASEFQEDRSGKAARLRLKVFTMASPFQPIVREKTKLFDNSEAEVKQKIANELKRPWYEIESELYADVKQYQRLLTFEGYPDAKALLSRYNVAQVQGCLYRAERMTVEMQSDFKDIIRYAKLAGLIHEIERLSENKYRLVLTGPVSVLHETRRYGVNMAKFLPALLSCREWRMQAEILTRNKRRVSLRLSSQDGLTSHLPPPEEFDSTLEEAFIDKWGEEREGWHIIREGGLLHERQTVFVPDFVFRHEDGREVFFEIVGFWTPEYLEEKQRKLQLFKEAQILLAIPEKSLEVADVRGDNVITYKTRIKIEPILEKLTQTFHKISS